MQNPRSYAKSYFDVIQRFHVDDVQSLNAPCRLVTSHVSQTYGVRGCWDVTLGGLKLHNPLAGRAEPALV